jgi:hypothetical protein
MMLVLLQFVGVAAMPLKLTVLVPWDAPKFTPVITIELPTGPELGERLVMFGATINGTPLLI